MIIKVSHKKQKYLTLHPIFRLKMVILFCYQLLELNLKFDVEFPSCQREKRIKKKKEEYQFVRESNYFPFLSEEYVF